MKFFQRTRAVAVWPSRERSVLVAGVCAAIHAGRLDRARQLLDSVEDRAARDAACLNLLGILYELHGDWDAARRCYGKAMRADGHYEPAQRNMRRWYELYTFGHSTEPVDL